MPTDHDLCLSWNWEHDADFIALVAAAFAGAGRSLLQVTPATLERTLAALAAGELTFRGWLDRASESDPRFLPLAAWARARGLPGVNGHDEALRASDKSALHRALFSVLRTPYTIVLAPFDAQPTLEGLDLAPLGPVFSIKPAHGGGGEGVVVEARTLAEVLAARRQFPADEYLVQTHIQAARPGGRLAWFRVIHCLGEIRACWWDPASHIYTPVTAAEEGEFKLGRLRELAATIARVTGLRLFSTEIALTPEGQLVVVDYANDPIDLRLQSRCSEGVPDDVARWVAARLASSVSSGA